MRPPDESRALHSGKVPSKLPLKPKAKTKKTARAETSSVKVPSEKEILDICKGGEDQLYEFKASGAEMRTLSKEICAFANTYSLRTARKKPATFLGVRPP
jgi:hypothetical protein